jgi:hypothetical protein
MQSDSKPKLKLKYPKTMNVIITHYKKKDNGVDTFYYEGKPVTQVTTAKLPLKFGYGSYNEPKKVFGTGINIEDIISIAAEGELNMSDS